MLQSYNVCNFIPRSNLTQPCDGMQRSKRCDVQLSVSIMEAIRKIRAQKQCPSLEKISKWTLNHINTQKTTMVDINDCLEELSSSGKVLKVCNKRGFSYRDPATAISKANRHTMKKRVTAPQLTLVPRDPLKQHSALQVTDHLKLVQMSLKELNLPDGASIKAIYKYLETKYFISEIPLAKFKRYIRMACMRGVKTGRLIKAGLSFKTMDEKKKNELCISSKQTCSHCCGTVKSKKFRKSEERLSRVVCGQSGQPSCMKLSAKPSATCRQPQKRCVKYKTCRVCRSERNSNLMWCRKCNESVHMECYKPSKHHTPKDKVLCKHCQAADGSEVNIRDTTVIPDKLTGSFSSQTSNAQESLKSNSDFCENEFCGTDVKRQELEIANNRHQLPMLYSKAPKCLIDGMSKFFTPSTSRRRTLTSKSHFPHLSNREDGTKHLLSISKDNFGGEKQSRRASDVIKDERLSIQAHKASLQPDLKGPIFSNNRSPSSSNNNKPFSFIATKQHQSSHATANTTCTSPINATTSHKEVKVNPVFTSDDLMNDAVAHRSDNNICEENQRMPVLPPVARKRGRPHKNVALSTADVQTNSALSFNATSSFSNEFPRRKKRRRKVKGYPWGRIKKKPKKKPTNDSCYCHVLDGKSPSLEKNLKTEISRPNAGACDEFLQNNNVSRNAARSVRRLSTSEGHAKLDANDDDEQLVSQVCMNQQVIGEKKRHRHKSKDWSAKKQKLKQLAENNLELFSNESLNATRRLGSFNGGFNILNEKHEYYRCKNKRSSANSVSLLKSQSQTTRSDLFSENVMLPTSKEDTVQNYANTKPAPNSAFLQSLPKDKCIAKASNSNKNSNVTSSPNEHSLHCFESSTIATTPKTEASARCQPSNIDPQKSRERLCPWISTGNKRRRRSIVAGESSVSNCSSSSGQSHRKPSLQKKRLNRNHQLSFKNKGNLCATECRYQEGNLHKSKQELAEVKENVLDHNANVSKSLTKGKRSISTVAFAKPWISSIGSKISNFNMFDRSLIIKNTETVSVTSSNHMILQPSPLTKYRDMTRSNHGEDMDESSPSSSSSDAELFYVSSTDTSFDQSSDGVSDEDISYGQFKRYEAREITGCLLKNVTKSATFDKVKSINTKQKSQQLKCGLKSDVQVKKDADHDLKVKHQLVKEINRNNVGIDMTKCGRGRPRKNPPKRNVERTTLSEKRRAGNVVGKTMNQIRSKVSGIKLTLRRTKHGYHAEHCNSVPVSNKASIHENEENLSFDKEKQQHQNPELGRNNTKRERVMSKDLKVEEASRGFMKSYSYPSNLSSNESDPVGIFPNVQISSDCSFTNKCKLHHENDSFTPSCCNEKSSLKKDDNNVSSNQKLYDQKIYNSHSKADTHIHCDSAWPGNTLEQDVNFSSQKNKDKKLFFNWNDQVPTPADTTPTSGEISVMDKQGALPLRSNSINNLKDEIYHPTCDERVSGHYDEIADIWQCILPENLLDDPELCLSPDVLTGCSVENIDLGCVGTFNHREDTDLESKTEETIVLEPMVDGDARSCSVSSTPCAISFSHSENIHGESQNKTNVCAEKSIRDTEFQATSITNRGVTMNNNFQIPQFFPRSCNESNWHINHNFYQGTCSDFYSNTHHQLNSPAYWALEPNQTWNQTVPYSERRIVNPCVELCNFGGLYRQDIMRNTTPSQLNHCDGYSTNEPFFSSDLCATSRVPSISFREEKHEYHGNVPPQAVNDFGSCSGYETQSNFSYSSYTPDSAVTLNSDRVMTQSLGCGKSPSSRKPVVQETFLSAPNRDPDKQGLGNHSSPELRVQSFCRTPSIQSVMSPDSFQLTASPLQQESFNNNISLQPQSFSPPLSIKSKKSAAINCSFNSLQSYPVQHHSLAIESPNSSQLSPPHVWFENNKEPAKQHLSVEAEHIVSSELGGAGLENSCDISHSLQQRQQPMPFNDSGALLSHCAGSLVPSLKQKYDIFPPCSGTTTRIIDTDKQVSAVRTRKDVASSNTTFTPNLCHERSGDKLLHQTFPFSSNHMGMRCSISNACYIPHELAGLPRQQPTPTRPYNCALDDFSDYRLQQQQYRIDSQFKEINPQYTKFPCFDYFYPTDSATIAHMPSQMNHLSTNENCVHNTTFNRFGIEPHYFLNGELAQTGMQPPNSGQALCTYFLQKTG